MVESNVAASQPSSGKHASRIFGHYLVKQRFQMKFSLMVFGFMAVATLTIWLFGDMALKQMISNETIKDEYTILQLENLNSLIFKISVMYMAVALFLSLMFSHLVAGPIYRFEKTLEEMRAGNLKIFVKLRKRDEFKETAELFNQAISSLRNKLQKERDLLTANTDSLKAFVDKLKRDGREEEAAALEKIYSTLRNTPPQIKI